MDHYQNVVDFDVTDEQTWASSLPHHPSQQQQQSTYPTSASGTTTGFGLTDQLPLPQDGLGHFSAALPDGLPQPGGSATSPPAFVSHPPASGGSAAAQQHREYMKAKRRVPASQRKRTQVSCDACKTRRCKCVRLGTTSGAGSDDEANLPPCKLCTESGVRCITTMPRKKRVYGSVENLDKRYRALEALISGVFPQLNPRASAEELVGFGLGMGYKMPDFADSPDQSKASTTTGGTSIPTPSSSTSDRAPYLGLDTADPVNLEHNYPTLSPTYTTKNTRMVLQLFPRPLHQGGMDTEDGSSGLVLDSSGRPHYIGPSGALTFLWDVRNLVSRTLAARGGAGAMRWQDQGDRSGTATIIGEKLSGSLGGTVTHPGPRQVSPSQARKLSSTGTRHLDADEPGLTRNEADARYSSDPNYWQYHRPASMIELPPREQAESCIQAYFQQVHPNFILFHRSTFELSYQKLRRSCEAAAAARRGPPRGGGRQEEDKEVTVSTGWLLCLYMIFTFGSRSMPQTLKSLEFQRKWHGEVEKLPSLLYTASLPNICGYMLLSLYSYQINDQISAWMYHGAACRFAIALGMHREPTLSSFEPLQRYLRKRIWWTLYSYEQFLCCSLGRPSAIDCRDMDVGIPDDDFLEGVVLPSRYLEHAIALYVIIAAVRREIFDPAYVPCRMYRRAVDFLEPLASWRDNLPRRLNPSSAKDGLDGNEQPWRRTYMLHIRYHHTLCVLTRPFLLKTIQSANSGSPLGPDGALIVALGRVCLTGAMRAGQLLNELSRADTINGVTWMDIFYAYLSCLNIILALLSPETLEQDWDKGHAPPPFRQTQHVESYTVEELKNAVWGLCHIMANVEVCGTNARFAKASIELAKTTGIIGIDDPAFKTSPLSNARQMAEEQGTGTEDPDSGGDGNGKGIETRNYEMQQQQQQQQQQPYYPVSGGEYQMWNLGLENENAPMDFTGILDGDNQSPGGTGGAMANNSSGIQWDMVMPSAQWDDGVLNMDLSWDWPIANANAPPNYQGNL